MNTFETKIEIFNPIDLHNTIGEELLEMFNENKYSFDILNSLNISIEKPKEVLKISKNNISKIAKFTNNDFLYDYLINFQEDYKISKDNSESEYKTLKKVYSKVKHLENFICDENFDGMDKLEDIALFLEIDDEKNIFQEVNDNIALYKISNFQPDNLNLYAWLKKGERDFRKNTFPKYNSQELKLWITGNEWKNNINNLKYFLQLPKILSEFGVALILTPYLKKTVFGCVRWFEGRPVIQISDKGKNLANLWYVLFHELGHVIKHENDEIFEGNDISKNQVTKKEKEANEFASFHLFNGDSLRKFIFSKKGQTLDDSFIESTAEKYNVNILFSALWAQKAQIKGISYYKYIKEASFK
ncbi:HTH-type transcriptional regulator/antitoxin HigA [Chryseobacterium sp. SORGH_AS 447]|uniref:ImmA/IrrE family metallo-endopeptidase n=1 Tax=Chryseobacterium sp. SORGH_AS_0447 TaxID=3041769 RepID=UPI0027860B2B|nr:ImmA/IrrE family metallo-endopeptidase [Chryseobacterium sp. SORGH_AS_0447]MDQ1160645.1 HTH-type transcriptional regulator/antitoxin HigA [Chryseobacterium sp. SORGH_AS_0447]